MAELVLNPNSIYKNSQANFILNKEALYTFTRSVSAINDSIYGFQPTKQQLISGFDLSDCSDYSLCSNVGKLNNELSGIENGISALKFFSTRPFEVYDNFNEMSADAKNPLAVYLTPVFLKESGEISVFQLDFDGTLQSLYPSEIEEWKKQEPRPEPWWEDQHWHFLSTDGIEEYEVETTDHNEWIYVLPASISSWEQIEEIYGDGTYLSSLSGKWELIGSTSVTDGDIDKIKNQIAKEESQRTEADSQLETSISNLNSNLIAEIERAEAAEIVLNDKISTETQEREQDINSLNEELSDLKEHIDSSLELYLPLSGEKRITGDVSSSNSIFFNDIQNPFAPVILENSVKINKDGLTVKFDPHLLGPEDPANYTVQYTANKIVINPTANTQIGLKYPNDSAKEIVSSYEETFATREWTLLNLSELSVDTANAAIALANNYTDTSITNLSIDNRLRTLSTDVISEARSYSDIVSANLSNAFDLSSYAKETWVLQQIEDIGLSDALSSLSTEILSVADNNVSTIISNYALKEEIPTSLSDLTNDPGFLVKDDISSLELSVSGISGTIDVLCSALSLEISGLNASYVDFASVVIDELSNNIGPKLSTYVSKEEISSVIFTTISSFNDYASGTSTPNAISSIIEWNKAIHNALLSVCRLTF